MVNSLTRSDVLRSKAELEERLYGWQEEVESNAVEVHMHNLRFLQAVIEDLLYLALRAEIDPGDRAEPDQAGGEEQALEGGAGRAPLRLAGGGREQCGRGAYAQPARQDRETVTATPSTVTARLPGSSRMPPCSRIPAARPEARRPRRAARPAASSGPDAGRPADRPRRGRRPDRRARSAQVATQSTVAPPRLRPARSPSARMVSSSTTRMRMSADPAQSRAARTRWARMVGIGGARVRIGPPQVENTIAPGTYLYRDKLAAADADGRELPLRTTSGETKDAPATRARILPRVGRRGRGGREWSASAGPGFGSARRTCRCACAGPSPPAPTSTATSSPPPMPTAASFPCALGVAGRREGERHRPCGRLAALPRRPERGSCPE
jgi:hypothetical protein